MGVWILLLVSRSRYYTTLVLSLHKTADKSGTQTLHLIGIVTQSYFDFDCNTMTANASWSAAPGAVTSQGNASWGITTRGQVRGGVRKENMFLKRMSMSKEALLEGGSSKTVNDGSSMKSRFDVASMTSKKGGPSPFLSSRNVISGAGDGSSENNKLSAAVSMSALSHMTLSSSSQADEQSSGKLRNETLLSLGISAPGRRAQQPLRSALKKQGGGMSRALTMASVREVEICLPNDKTISRNTSINFNESVKVRKIPSSSSLAQHKKDLWFQDDEMKLMRQKAKSMASMAEVNGANDDSFVKHTGDSLRGLERYVDTRGHSRTRRNKFQVWDAILDEQEDMRYRGKDYDDERLADLCRSVSMDSMRAAQLRAQEDASVVQRLIGGEA